MTLLLDTHVWFWALESPDKIGRKCRASLESTENVLVVATISTVELGQLVSTEKIRFKSTLESWVRRGTESLGMRATELSHAIALLAYSLPGVFHKDPADRILVATAIHHGYTIVSANERILAYPHVMSMNARR